MAERGELLTWGKRDDGRLGYEAENDQLVPRVVPLLRGIRIRQVTAAACSLSFSSQQRAATGVFLGGAGGMPNQYRCNYWTTSGWHHQSFDVKFVTKCFFVRMRVPTPSQRRVFLFVA